jgi:UDP-2,3-diacylglucosamine pyrophosphatase LpxH
MERFDESFLNTAKSTSLWGDLNGQAATVSYFQTSLPYQDLYQYGYLSDRLDDECRVSARVASTAKETSHALSPINFVYLDVGCWAGDGGDRGWPLHREFGIVYGSLVLLCSYAKLSEPKRYSRYCNPSTWTVGTARLTRSLTVDDTICDQPDWKPVGQLLDALADAVKDSGLYILGATCVSSPYTPIPTVGKSTPIRVFLGDLHAPVATNRQNAHIVENGHEMLKGRIKPGVAQSEMRWNEIAGADEIDDWLRLYHVDGQRTADIFQGAGKDLRAFVDRLALFHEETRPVELVQLGDLFDLWIGFMHAFGERQDGYDAINHQLECTMEFARYWVERSLFSSEQGSHLVHLLTLGQWAKPNKNTKQPLKTTFLYGNHDNYLKHGGDSGIRVPAGYEHAGRTVPTFHLPASIEMDGLWAEHGHQCDTFNWDKDPRPGHALTQAVFLQSGVRSLEKLGGWAFAFGDGKRIQRVVSIQHAMNRCLLNHIGRQVTAGVVGDAPHAPCRGIYVMGHTHEAMLKRVELLP